MNPIIRRFALAGLLFLSARVVQAQPANDLFANAWTLTGTVVSTNGNTMNGGEEPGEPNHAGNNGGRSVWFSWTAPRGGQIRVDTIGSAHNTLLAVYTGNAVNSLTLIAENNDAPGLGGGVSLVEFVATEGVTYRVVVDSWRQFNFFPPGGGPYVLNITTLASIEITSPAPGTVFGAGDSIAITATGEVPNPPITRFDFYRNEMFLGTDDTDPYEFTAENSPPGTNRLTAVAIDNAGLSWTSAVVNVAVFNTGLTIVSPDNGATFINADPIPVVVVGFLESGAITNVEFFVDGAKFGEDLSAPFNATWAAVTGGSHRLTATGRDNSGTLYGATPVNIGVASVLVPRGAVWKYLDDGSDQGTAWREREFADASWAEGPAELGYGDNDEATVVGFGPDPNNKYPTTYYRHSFNLVGAAGYSQLIASVKRDDGAVVYLNGTEVGRFNMLDGPINFDTFAPNTQDETTFFPGEFPPELLVEGLNVLAVEIHQTGPDSSDTSFDMDLIGVPVVVLNQSPEVALTSPVDAATFLAPATITLEATASDSDGSVTNVEFYVDGELLGGDETSPYSMNWVSPPLGPHTLHAVATDDQGASLASTPVNIVVYDMAGTPFARVTAPPNGTVVEGPTNMVVTAFASALAGVTNVQFRADAAVIGNVAASPYEILWAAPFGTNALRAVTFDSNGRRGTSAVVTVVVTIPPTNTVAPTIAAQDPPAGADITNLTTIAVTFSERVLNVDAADLLIDGVPALEVSGFDSNYFFTVTQPDYGQVDITWIPGHGITDIGYPANLPFNQNGPGASWSYNLIDRVPPTVVDQQPAPGGTLTNLTEITVNFSEAVTGVNASDFLVAGVPAFGVSGTGSNYTFSFSQPPSGVVNISWVSGHGITDQATSPNAFDANGPGATWNYTLDTRSILIQSNSTWRFMKGTAEASDPLDAWRLFGFNDAGWSNALAPFYYGDPYNTPGNPGTLLNDMQGGYSSVYLRKQFTVLNSSFVTNMFLSAQSDDGFIAWINGVEVARFNMVPGDAPFNGTASNTAQEPNNNGAGYELYDLPDPQTYLQEGLNFLTVHAFNQSLDGSSDFGFNAQLYTFLPDIGVVAPRIAEVTPAAGEVFQLTAITVRFSEPVGGVEATDFLINGSMADTVTSTTNTTYTFGFSQPQFGLVSVSWVAAPGIVDFDSTPKAFDGTALGATFQYSLVNPSAPTVGSQAPLAGAMVNELTLLSVTFSEPVANVNAADLLINGVAATGITGSGANYTFSFAQPAYGPVSIGWAVGHGITDLEVPTSAFDGTRAGNVWGYTLVDQTPPTVAVVNPAPGSQVTNVTQVSVTFSEEVLGVDAFDLLVNGTPATAVSGLGATYTFVFAQPNATVVTFTWANTHGIRDLAPVPNPFNNTGPGAIWSYSTPDTLAPSVVFRDPPPFVTVRSLTQIRVRFDEPVVGVDTSDLLVNDSPGLAVSGSGAGPYTFSFLSPSNGVVEVRWAAGHGITDLALPTPNPFGGGEWTYTLDPNAVFAGNVLINELMFNPRSGLPAEEWLELRNVTSGLINLTGWRFTRGINFTFPNVSIPGNGYLVVAADVATFQARYPGVMNVVGGWQGRLSNSDETLQLETALGEEVDRVHYATEGDWARRERGHGAELVTSIVRNGGTATVRVFNHGYTGNDRIMITGADQPEYNGLYTINNVNDSTFNINVAGNPASPATGNIIVRQVVDDGTSGWSWFSAADGFGSSLELVNPDLPSNVGANWLASTELEGTPGRVNSVATNNVAPLLLDVTHFPLVPRSTDSVAITARVVDEVVAGIQSVTLFYRNHTTSNPGGFLTAAMLDDGVHSDGASGDGLFGAVLPPAANGAVFEFYVRATDTGGHSRTWPAPTWETNNTFGQLANALFQVDDEVISNPMPSIRIIMSGTEDASFPPGNRNSDGEMNATMISIDGAGTAVRYLTGVRVRGAGSRTRTPPNNRVNIPNNNRWNNLSGINLNGQFVHAQLMGAAVARKAGLPAADGYVFQYRINGDNPARITAPQNGSGTGDGYGSFFLVKPVNSELAADVWPEDPDGNVYRASTGNHSASLNYLGTDPDEYLDDGYFKTSNQTENDWSDMFNLTFAFSQVASDEDYYEAMRTNVNAEVWMRYFALGSLINFGETSMFNGRGDDYALYRGLKDPRFVPIGHDFDTVFGQGDTLNSYPVQTGSSIYIMLNPPFSQGTTPNMPLLRRFITNPRHAPIFFAELKRLADTVFSPEQLDPLMDQLLTGWGNGPSTTTIEAMKTHAANRRATVLSQIPLTLTFDTSLFFSGGFLVSTTPDATFNGTGHAILTRKVLVNGVEANWAPWDARWTNTITLQPGVNRVVVQAIGADDVELERVTRDIRYDDGSVTAVSGMIATDTVWTAAEGPIQVTGTLTVNAGATLTVQPGTSVFFNGGGGLTIANGGRLLAVGTDTSRIRFSSVPGGALWRQILINGGPGSPETRIAYAHIDNNALPAIQVTDGTVFLDHLSFGNNTRQYVSLDRASFVVQDCVFPTALTAFEPVHGSGGIKAGGRGLFLRNFFGKANGYNDVIDFTGGNRPGPIVQIIDNVFMGSDDDLLDLDSTDAWVEGNIFLHTHRNGSPDSASAVSGGADNADTSEITVVGNLFYDLDHAANAKQGNFYTFVNNTIVRQTRVGGEDTESGVITMADEGTAIGAGFYLEGNIIHDAEHLVRTQGMALVTFTNNIMPFAWSGPGGNNSNVDPGLRYIPQLSETTNFTSWAEAQVMWDWFSLRAGSPGQGTGPNARDKGGVIPLGASISGEPFGTTPLNSAVLRVNVNRTGQGIPVAGFPDGSGYTHYRWRLDGGPWSSETPTAVPIVLNGLGTGPHFVEVVGKRDAGFYQDDPVYGSNARITVSRTWTVDPSASPLKINEVLASNGGAVPHLGTTPDVIELYNDNGSALDLSGVRLTDDLTDPDKFTFPPGASIPGRGYLVVYANNPDGTPGYHLGFNLSQSGESIYLIGAAGGGGALLDSVTFGLQLTDRSIGRLADGRWALCQPTFGSQNRAAELGDPRRLVINEWLARAQAPFDNDYVEIYNQDALPVSLGGLYVSDEPLGHPTLHQMAALSFIDGNAYLRLIADGNPAQGANHLNFSLNGEVGAIGLFLPDLTTIDCVYYQPQRLNVSQGRSPNASGNIVFFSIPTPGAPNPLVTGPEPNGGVLVINEVLAINSGLLELNGRSPDWIELYNGSLATVNLGDYSLTDDTLLARKYAFPSPTFLAPGAYLRVICDPGATNPGPLVTISFGLSGTGGGVYLFDSLANGGSLLNAINYGLQVPNLSIGRVPDGGTNWVLTSPTPAAANAAIQSLGNHADLKLNEWMADPSPGNDDWFELYNPGPLPVALAGLYLSDDFNDRTKHQIAPLSFIGFGVNGFIQFRADGNTGAGADHVSFSLRGAGEDIGVSDRNGSLINGFSFGPQAEGISEGRFPDGAETGVRFPGTDSPGSSNWRLLQELVINEVLTHTDLPVEDAIELHNLGGQAIDIGGWWLSDDPGTLQKYQLPSPTVVPAGGFTVIYENQFTNRELAAIPFALSSQGDEVVLSAFSNNALTGFRAQVRFGAAANAVSFGRYVTSDQRSEFVALDALTFGVSDPGSVSEFRMGTGASNAYPRVGPIVIAEVMYHPPDLNLNDNTRDEFIELRNTSTVSVPLYDPAHTTNVWRLRDAVDFDFPAGTVLHAGETLLVVGFDPVNNPSALGAFRSAYDLSAGIKIVGPWTGRLANDTDDIELRRPDLPGTNSVPYILVERVRYFDSTPWPASADGTGFSLQRVNNGEFGNDPINWIAGAPTPGPSASQADSDEDGLPDSWENLYGLDPLNPADAGFDNDLDGLTNLEEFLSGTNPLDPGSVLRFISITGEGQVQLSFTALADRTYSVLWRESVSGGQWIRLADVTAMGFDRVETVEDVLPPAGTRIYLLVTPQLE